MVPIEYRLIIDKTIPESLVLTVHERTAVVDIIEKIIKAETDEITAFGEDEIFRVALNKIYCFYTDSGRVYIRTDNEKLMIKQRLCNIENTVDENFIKINQGCIINKNYVKKFKVSIGGAIKVCLKNGFEDYISRRELKKVKRSFGL